MHIHQLCDSNCLRTQVMAQNVISKFQWRSETFFIGIIEFLAPKNICIDTNFVTQTALELKLWHKT